MRRGLLILGLSAALQATGAAAQPADSGEADAIGQLLSTSPVSEAPPTAVEPPVQTAPTAPAETVATSTPSAPPPPVPTEAAMTAPAAPPPPAAAPDLAAAVFAAPQAQAPAPTPPAAAPLSDAPALAANPPAGVAPSPPPSAPVASDLAAAVFTAPQSQPSSPSPTAVSRPAESVAASAAPELTAPPPAAVAAAVTPSPPPQAIPVPDVRPAPPSAPLASTYGASSGDRGDSRVRAPPATPPPAALAAGPRGYQPSNPGLPYTRYQSVQRPTRIEETGVSPDSPLTERDIAYESRVRGAFAASARSLGPLDGRWELAGPTGGLFAFQFADRAALEGVWRDLGRSPGAVGALGLIDQIDRTGDSLTLRFRPRPGAGPVTVTLQRQPEGDWRGEISGAQSGEVRLRRN